MKSKGQHANLKTIKWETKKNYTKETLAEITNKKEKRKKKKTREKKKINQNGEKQEEMEKKNKFFGTNNV